MKQTYRLTESELRDMIAETVKNALNEIGDTKRGQFALNAVRGRAAARPRYQNHKYNSVPGKAKQDRILSMAGDEAWKGRKETNNVGNREWDNAANSGYYYGYQKGMKG